MALAAGTRLGPYEILAPIGAGGMGEVYRARDTKLKRDVAVKILPQAFAHDPDRMQRFQREAELLASLNHPHIAHIYGVEDRALVMELVEGETLPAGLSIEAALLYAKQIAEALEYAHERGVIHRDLKPANVQVTPEGNVKLLDFGLAKATEDPVAAGDDPSQSPTLTLGATRMGVILGTAAYMSPEQASGKVADRRADIWSFGAVLYEMLSGRKAFAGESASDTLATVLKLDPDWNALPAQTPASIRRLVRRCLTKDRKQRLQAIGEARIAIEESLSGAPPEPREPTRNARNIIPWTAAAVAALSLGALSFVHFREQPPVAEVTRFQIAFPANDPSRSEISPDGRKLAFGAPGADGSVHLWIRSFDSLDAGELPGIELLGSPKPFFWSSDSRFLAFYSNGKLKKVAVSGGPAQTLCEGRDVVGGSWSRDGVILFGGQQEGVMQVSQTGGGCTALTALDPSRNETGHMFPKFLPDGRHFLYSRWSSTPGNTGIYVGATDLKPSQQSSKPLLVNEAMPEFYVPSLDSSSRDSNNGWLLFYREGTVLAQPFNPSKVELSGDPIPIAEQVGAFLSLFGLFSASASGTLVYAGGTSGGSEQLTWFDREGKSQGTVGEPGLFGSSDLSRDGRHAVVSRYNPQTAMRSDLWLLDLTRGGTATRFTFDSEDNYPVFSPGGERVVFTSERDGAANLYQKLTSGVKDEEPLLKSDETMVPSGWSRDGRWLLYSVSSSKTKYDIWILPMDGSQKPMLFLGTQFNERDADFSPDGRWIAYDSDESGRFEIYVREFSLGQDGKPEATAKHQISSGGGTFPRWRDDGKELIYIALDRTTVMSVVIGTKPAFQAWPAKALFRLPGAARPAGVTSDHKRFLALVPVQQTGPQQFTVVLNWQAGLKK